LNIQITHQALSVLAAYKYSCSHFNDWVIAFKIKDGALIVYEIIHGSLLF